MGRAYRPKVLIETYWNVNTVAGGVDYAASVVLIETYWNVNVIAQTIADYLGVSS